jgi:hypothetical protein
MSQGSAMVHKLPSFVTNMELILGVCSIGLLV